MNNAYSNLYWSRTRVILVCLSLLFSGSTFAGQSDNQGQGKDKSNKVKTQSQKKNKNKKSTSLGVYFTLEHRDIVFSFYSSKFSAGNCPPGLAKKNNGCLPPGQAKKWRRGYPLPGDVTFYDLPIALLKEIGRAPDGHKFVRVGADILLIAIGTAIVIDAIEDLADLL